MSETIIATIRFRRGTAALWAQRNPTPASGEPCLETDTGLVKVGNGVDDWNTLDYLAGAAITGLVERLDEADVQIADIDGQLATVDDRITTAISESLVGVDTRLDGVDSVLDGRLSDGALAAKIGTVVPPAVDAAIADADIPGQVVEAIADSPTVEDAVNAAAGPAVAGMVGSTLGDIPSEVLVNRAKNPALSVDVSGWQHATAQGTVGGAGTGRVARAARWVYRMVWTAAGATAGGGRILAGASTNTMVAVGPGVHTFSLDLKASRQQMGNLNVTPYTAANAVIGTTMYGGYKLLPAGVEQRLSLTVTLPANTDHVRVEGEATAGHASSSVWQIGDTLEATNLLVETGDVAHNYFDGDSGGSAWSGTPGNSTSTRNIVKAAPIESPRFTGTPSLEGDPFIGSGAIDRLFPHPRNVGDIASQLMARSRVRSVWREAQPVRNAAGYDLTALLGAGYTRHGGTFATRADIPARWITTRPVSLTIGSDTLVRNTLTPGVLGSPLGLEMVAKVTGTGQAIALEGNAAHAVHEVGVYIDGQAAGPWVRDPAGGTGLRAWKIALPEGVHRVKIMARYVDVLALAASSGVTLTATTAIPPQWGLTGDSWFQHGTDFGRSYSNSQAWLLAEALGVEVWNFAVGGTGYVNPGAVSKFGSTARLDIIEDVNDNIAALVMLIVGGSQNDFGAPSSVQAEAVALFAAIATRCPATKIIPIGPPTFPNHPNTNPATATAGIVAAAVAANVLANTVIAPVTEKWYTPEMWTALMFDVDHPTVEGLAYHARRSLVGIIKAHRTAGIVLDALDGWSA